MVCQVLPQYDLKDKALAESKVEPCRGTGRRGGGGGGILGGIERIIYAKHDPSPALGSYTLDSIFQCVKASRNNSLIQNGGTQTLLLHWYE